MTTTFTTADVIPTTGSAPTSEATPLPTTTAGGTPVLDLRDVTVRHRDGVQADGSPRWHTALDGVSLQTRAGDFTVVLGPSGSGKSTLLCVAAGLQAPGAGSVRVAGQELSTLDDDQRSAVRRAHVGMVFQQANLFASLTSEEQLLLPLTLTGARPSRADRARALDLLRMVDLAGLERRRPHEMSGGQRQRVTIARALMGQPELLLVDEPTSALDHATGRRVVALLRRVTDEIGTSTVMVTHDETVADAADRVVRLQDGRVVEGVTSRSVGMRHGPVPGR